VETAVQQAGRRGAARRKTAGNGGEASAIEVLAEEAVDDGIGGAVAVAEQLEDGEENASDGATVRAAVPQKIDLHTPHIHDRSLQPNY